MTAAFIPRREARQYAVARFGAFSNLTWDLGDDLDQYRDDERTRATGTLIKELDPYRHLATSHPVDNVHQDRTANWFDFTSFQEWSRAQHAFMLGERKEQARLGRARRIAGGRTTGSNGRSDRWR